MAELTARPIQPVPGSFNWIYLIEYIVCGILSLFFLFYFNRLFATLISYALRLYAWHQFRVYIDIEALQISLLAGRIFFKGIRYHGDNETIFVHAGNITWRYWLLKVRGPPICDGNPPSVKHETANEAGAKHPAKRPPPCRIAISLSGVEAFCYNRSPSYDWILETLRRNEEEGPSGDAQTNYATFSEKAGYEFSRAAAEGHSSSTELSRTQSAQASYLRNLRRTPSLQPQRTRSTVSGGTEQDAPQPPFFLQMLPVHVMCTTAAVVLGNPNTRAIITAKIASATGTVDASHAGPLDLFKLELDFDLEHPLVQMKPNVDYKESQLSEAVALKADARLGQELEKRRWFKKRRRNTPDKTPTKSRWRFLGLSAKAIESLESVAIHSSIDGDGPYGRPRRSIFPAAERWHGLARYLEDGIVDKNDEWDPIEYAKVSTLADIKGLNFRFYWDIPGKVPLDHPNDTSRLHSISNDMNGAAPPAYGMEFVVRGGLINYGPWTDRHRVELQQLFFPMMYSDAKPACMIEPGQDRISTVFNIKILIDDDTTLRIPFREPSKDWRWQGRSATYKEQTKEKAQDAGASSKTRKKHAKGKREKSTATTDIRPFAWFDLRVKQHTCVRYTMDMMPRKEGFKNSLTLDANRLEIFSSLNHALLWTCPKVSLSCNLSNPLAWRGLREWTFDIHIGGLDFFLLRDHTFLMVDMIEDWSRGPEPDYYTWIPFRYLLRVRFDNFKLYLNVNDANIVNHSDDPEENDFVILYGKRLVGDLTIPLDRLRPATSDLKFDVTGTDLGFELMMPSKNTLSDLLVNKNVAQLPEAIVKGVYSFCSESGPGKTETLTMDIVGTGLDLQAYGFFVRQLVKIRENYFGEQVHFKTTEEYQETLTRRNKNLPIEEPAEKSSDLDTILNIRAKNATLQLPSGLYSSAEHVWLKVDTVDIDIRVNNYYLELVVDSTPVELGYASHRLPDGQTRPDTDLTLTPFVSGTEFFIDGVSVFGHRFFGVGKGDPAYISNWDVSTGELTSRNSCEFIAKLLGSVGSLALTINDKENALPVMPPPPSHDRSYVRFACPLIQLQSEIGEETFVVTVKGIEGSFNDAVDNQFSQRVLVDLPVIEVACLDSKALARNTGAESSPETLGFLRTSGNLSVLERAAHFEEKGAAQRDLIAEMDAKGRRATFFYPNGEAQWLFPASIPLPTLPLPVTADEDRQDTFPIFNRPKSPSSPSPLELHRRISSPRHDSIDHQQFENPPSLTSVYKEPFRRARLSNVDLHNVPYLAEAPIPPRSATSEASSINEFFNPDFAADAAHTGVIVSLSPGITGFITPRVPHAIATAIDRISPAGPESVLDALQTATISEVLNSLNKSQGKNSILDLAFLVPRLHLRFLNTENEQEMSKAQTDADQWDFTAGDISATVRLKTLPERANESDSTIVYFSTKSMSLGARPKRNDFTASHAPFKMTIDQVLVWMVDGDRTSIHASSNGLEMILASKQTSYLAHLVYRTTVFADALQARFAEISTKNSRRLQLVTYDLTKAAADLNDPIFLTRPAHAMSRGGEQIRTTDSWKILSKLRHAYVSLDSKQRALLLQRCASPSAQLPHDHENYVLASLDSWRSWEAIRVRESFAMRIVYGNLGGIEKLHDRSRIPLSLRLEVGSIKGIVDPGTRQNVIAVDGLGVALAIAPPPTASAMELFQEHGGTKSTTVQANTSSMSLLVNWDICELVDQILDLFKQSNLQSHPVVDPPKTAQPGNGQPETFHVVLSSKQGLVEVETPSLTQTYSSDAMRLSVTAATRRVKDLEFTVNALAHADATHVVLKTHDRVLMRGGLTKPTFWITYDGTTEDEEKRDRIQIISDSDQLTWHFQDELQGIVEAADSVLRREVVQLKRLIESYIPEQSPDAPDAAPRETRGNPELGMTLFCKKYHLSVRFTQDTSYELRGDVARLSIRPDKSLPLALAADFDLHKQVHQLLAGKGESVGIIEIPPINGSATVFLQEGQQSVACAVSMEEIVFDGSIVFGIIKTLATNQIKTAIAALSDDIAALTDTINSIFSLTRRDAQPSPSPEIATRPSTTPIFDVSAALAGVTLSAKAPGKTADFDAASVSFFTGPIQTRVSNRSNKPNAPALPFPEISLSLQKAGAEFTRTLSTMERDSIGRIAVAIAVMCTVSETADATYKRDFKVSIYGPSIAIARDTGPAIVTIASHLQSRVESLHLDEQRQYLKRIFHPKKTEADQSQEAAVEKGPSTVPGTMETDFEFDLRSFRIVYQVEESKTHSNKQIARDLSLTLEALNLTARSTREAKMQVANLMVQLTHKDKQPSTKNGNYALLPEALFHVTHNSTSGDRKVRFGASGRALEVWLDAQFVVPVKALERSLDHSVTRVKEVAASLKLSQPNNLPRSNLLGTKLLSHVVVDARFAGAVINIQRSRPQDRRGAGAGCTEPAIAMRARYSQVTEEDAAAVATLRAPGVGLKVEHTDPGEGPSSLNIEFRVDGSNNAFSPTVVPILLELSDSIKQVVEQEPVTRPSVPADKTPQKFIDDEALLKADPTAILGKTKLNIGFRICRQEFTLSCHPIAKIAATASINDIYFSVNTVDAEETGHFFAASATFKDLVLSLKHDYSRDATFGFSIDSVMMSLMNSKHLNGMAGVSAILRVEPSRTHVNAKQLQDILLFREIWLPPEIRGSPPDKTTPTPPADQQQEYFVQRYHQLAANKSFRWNATVAIAEMKVDLDLGQTIGKISLGITDLWASSRKSSASRQALCIGIDNIFAHSAGRMSGLLELCQVKVRTSIAWPADKTEYQTPLIQASIGFNEIRIKTAFDYQLFLIAYVTDFEFIMYNVRDRASQSDRLVAILDGSKVYAYCTTSSASLGLALYQALERLFQEKKTSYEQALKDIERYLHRRRSMDDARRSTRSAHAEDIRPETPAKPSKPYLSTLKLHSNVVVSLRALDLGAFPGTFFDPQLVRLTASDVQAGFAVVLDESEQIHSRLSLMLGKVNAALASVPSPVQTKPFAEVAIEEVVQAATSASRGVILGVPRVVASMQTWQGLDSNVVDYIFKSTFEGKIDVGWNYARISYIRGMWANHTRTLASRLGRPLPESALKITGGPTEKAEGKTTEEPLSREDQKITAVVNLPQSKYQYQALEPPIIDTPQLRDMGDATPPLEWVGLQRDRLPNITHQILIVTLLEVAREVEDAYTKILGSTAS